MRLEALSHFEFHLSIGNAPPKSISSQSHASLVGKARLHPLTNSMSITPRQVDHLFISIYSLIIHLEISIQNIPLVLSCEPHPKCKPKATYNYTKILCVKSTILAPASTSVIVSPWWKQHIP